MVNETDADINHRDITTIIKDGISRVVEGIGKDGKPELRLEVNNKSAWWKTHSVNSARFGMMGEYLEDFDSYKDIVKFRMSKEMSDVLSLQIENQANVIRWAIDAKSSETMKNDRNAQTSLIDKYLANKQERVVDVKGEVSKSLMDTITGRDVDAGTR